MKYRSVITKLAIIGALGIFSSSALAMEQKCGGDCGHEVDGCMQMQGMHEGHGDLMNHDSMREMHGGMMNEGFPWMLKKKLGLTGKQAGEISDIMAEEHNNAKPLFVAVHKEKKDLMTVSMKGDQAAIKAQSGKLADAIASMAVHHAKCHKRIAAVMTKEQAEKFEKMSTEFGTRGEHGKKACGAMVGDDKKENHHMDHMKMDHKNMEHMDHMEMDDMKMDGK